MSYDVRFVQVPLPAGAEFPVAGAEAQAALKSATPIRDTAGIRELLLKVEGSRPGPNDAVDYVGRGLNNARMYVRPEGIHVENNCGPRELLKIYSELGRQLPNLYIFDLQSEQLHDARSLEAWWSRPL